jgi:hypothetical protein
MSNAGAASLAALIPARARAPAGALFWGRAHGFPPSHGAGSYRVKVKSSLRRTGVAEIGRGDR